MGGGGRFLAKRNRRRRYFPEVVERRGELQLGRGPPSQSPLRILGEGGHLVRVGAWGEGWGRVRVLLGFN